MIPSAIAVAALVLIVIGIVFLRGNSRGGSAARSAKSPAARSTLRAAAEAAGQAAELSKKPAPSQATGARETALRNEMRASAAAKKEWSSGAAALVELADIAPKAFEDREIVLAAVTIAAGIEVGGNEKADKVFDTLTNKLGGEGLDILYEIVSTRGGSKAAARASEILHKKEVFDRASPGLRIAIELRDANACKEKLELLKRAKEEGDSRAVAVLDIWRAQDCVPGAGECCFRTNQAVKDAVQQIWSRVRSSP